MKKYLFSCVLFISFFGFSQNNYIVKTDDGRRVLLKADFTWEYIDAVVPDKVDEDSKEAVAVQIAQGSSPLISKVNTKKCNTVEGFEEPKGQPRGASTFKNP